MLSRVFKLHKSLSLPKFHFSKLAGNIQSVDGHQAPLNEETVQGRYTGVLFSAASEKKALANVLADMQYLKELIDKSEVMRNFLQNTAMRRDQQKSILTSININQFDKVTQIFVDTLIENKRLDVLSKVVDKYIEYYKILQKEENVNIISAAPLNEQNKKDIQAALQKSHAGVTFQLSFTIDPTILGGLQMYSGNQFLDCSLATRVQTVKSELLKLKQ